MSKTAIITAIFSLPVFRIMGSAEKEAIYDHRTHRKRQCGALHNL